jgi:hypothetical protein
MEAITMRHVALLAMTVALAGVAASSVTAAPTDLQVRIDGKVQLISPGLLQVPVTYECPASFGTAFVSVGISQADTGAEGFDFTNATTCTGEVATVVFTFTSINAGTFLPGKAYAIATIGTIAQSDSRARRIHIVL